MGLYLVSRWGPLRADWAMQVKQTGSTIEHSRLRAMKCIVQFGFKCVESTMMYHIKCILPHAYHRNPINSHVHFML